jgi:hypothetical protein
MPLPSHNGWLDDTILYTPLLWLYNTFKKKPNKDQNLQPQYRKRDNDPELSGSKLFLSGTVDRSS